MAKGRKQSRQRPAGRRPGGSTIDRRRETVAGRATLGALLVLASAIVVYLNAFGNDFVLDDIALIRDNVRIRSLGNVPHLFASSYWGSGGAQALYRPLVLVTYALNYAVHGLSTIGYTAVNVSLHAAVSLLLFRTRTQNRRLARSRPFWLEWPSPSTRCIPRRLQQSRDVQNCWPLSSFS